MLLDEITKNTIIAVSNSSTSAHMIRQRGVGDLLPLQSEDLTGAHPGEQGQPNNQLLSFARDKFSQIVLDPLGHQTKAAVSIRSHLFTTRVPRYLESPQYDRRRCGQ